MDIEKIKKFVQDSNNVTSDKVFGMYFMQMAFALMILLASYDQKKSIFYVVAMILVSVIICACYAALGSKKSSLKNKYLFLGIIGIIIPVTCQIGCFLVSDLSSNQKVRLILILLFLSIIIYSSVVVIIKLMISNAEKLPTTLKVSRATVAPAAVLGTVFSGLLTKGYEKNVLIWCFAGLSLCFMFFTIYFGKYYYIIKLESLKEK